MNGSYTSLEPSNLNSLGVQAPTFTSGSNVSLFTTTSFAYSFFFTIIVMAAFYRYVLAGTFRMQASEASIRQSNEIIKKVTLGLLGVFSLFLILVTVNKDLVTGDVGLEVLTTKDGAVTAPQKEPVVVTGISRASPTNTSMQAAIDADPVVRQDLLTSNIKVNKLVCKTPGDANCTTVGGLPDTTITMLKSLRTTCPVGNLVISGGTEAGHSSHGPGKYPVDISLNQSGYQVENCIRSFTLSRRVPKRSGNVDLCYPGKVYENFGFVFCDEVGTDKHWHVYKP